MIQGSAEVADDIRSPVPRRYRGELVKRDMGIFQEAS